MNRQPIDIEQLLDQAIADGLRQRALASQRAAASRRLHRAHLFYRNVVMLTAMIATAIVTTACTPIPDGRTMSDVPSRPEALAFSNQLIAAL